MLKEPEADKPPLTELEDELIEEEEELILDLDEEDILLIELELDLELELELFLEIFENARKLDF
jgi:hypothetical protein